MNKFEGKIKTLPKKSRMSLYSSKTLTYFENNS